MAKNFFVGPKRLDWGLKKRRTHPLRHVMIFTRDLTGRSLLATLMFGVASLGFDHTAGAFDGTTGGDDLGLRVADGFVVEQFADDQLAHDIYSLSFDPTGEVVVAGAGYIRRLIDRDGDGTADDAATVADFAKSGAMGLCFRDGALYVTGDGGLWRLEDRDDDELFEACERILSLGGGEHGAHAIEVGPDGWLYVACGNGTGVGADHVTSATSPITTPQAGTIVRVSSDHQQTEVVADGFRNAYDFAFTRFGELVIFDSDGERVHHLPWYTPTRLFDVASGQSHGWLYSGSSSSWARPEYFFDNVQRLATFGRGSPTGVTVYRHERFPKRYHDGVFAACWTLGRIYFVPLSRDGATLAGDPEIFLESIGHNGFAPVDMAVGPAGELWIAIGGRRTRGGVFHVRPVTSNESADAAASDVDRVLSAPQPLSAWSRASWEPMAGELGNQAFETAARDTSRSTVQRVRAVEVLTSRYNGPSDATARALATDADAEVVARLAWSLGRSAPNHDRYQVLASLTASSDPLVQRSAWEALASLPQAPAQLDPSPAWTAAFESPRRRVRSAAIRLAQTSGATNYQHSVAVDELFDSTVTLTPRGLCARCRVIMPRLADTQDESERVTLDRISLGGARIMATTRDVDVRLEAVRLVQLAVGDVKLDVDDREIPGYIAVRPERLTASTTATVCTMLARSFPSGDERLDGEIARTLAMLAADNGEVLSRIAKKWNATSPAPRDIHYLIATSRIGGERSDEVVTQIARALVNLHGKLDAESALPSRMWPRRVDQALRAHLAWAPQLSSALLAQPDFGHAGHTLLADCLSDEERRAAARLLIDRLPADEDDEMGWTPDVVDFVACLDDDDVLPILREHWDNVRLADAITRVIARAPASKDRAQLINALGSIDQATVAAAVAGLEVLEEQASPRATPADLAAAIAAMRHLESAIVAIESDDATQRASRQFALLANLDKLLSRWTDDAASPTLDTAADVSAATARWQQWFATHYPDDTALLPGATASLAEWSERLDGVDFTAGDATRGKAVFEARGCHQCHQAAGRLGPELRGVTSRLERDDLLAAIVDPSREVAPPYHTWTVLTRSGDVLRGMLVYNSPASKLIQTGPDAVVRVTGDEIVREEPSTVSLMPSGLLDGLADGDIADLFAYLRSIN